MFCQKCGNQLNDGAAFCPKCGNPIGDTTPSSQRDNSTVSKQPVAKSTKTGISISQVLSIVAMVLFFIPLFMEVQSISWIEPVYSEVSGVTRDTRLAAPRPLYDVLGFLPIMLIVICLGACIYFSNKNIKKHTVTTAICSLIMLISIGSTMGAAPKEAIGRKGLEVTTTPVICLYFFSICFVIFSCVLHHTSEKKLG